MSIYMQYDRVAMEGVILDNADNFGCQLRCLQATGDYVFVPVSPAGGEQ